MNTQELSDYIRANIPTFQNIRIVGEGTAFHYTNHYLAIVEYGGFKGHSIDNNLDRTQMTIPSVPASDLQGVVFAYENLEDAIEEGWECDIIEISYSEAIIATHSQEALFDAPDTVIILCEYIRNFSKVELP